MIIKSPCQYCLDRKIGCHSRCERYLAFAEYRKRINTNRHKEIEVRVAFDQRKRATYWRNHRKGGIE